MKRIQTPDWENRMIRALSAVCILACFTGCETFNATDVQDGHNLDGDKTNEAHYEGVVVSSNGPMGSIGIRLGGDSRNHISMSDVYIVHSNGSVDLSLFQQGDIVKVWTDGIVRLSNPPQLLATKIEKR
jgi:hypothetical protein